MHLLLILGGLLLPLSPRPQDPASLEWQHHQGVVFELDHSPGLVVQKNGNGQVFFFDLRDPAAGADQDPVIRLMVLGSASWTTPDEWGRQVVQDLTARRSAEGWALIDQADCSWNFLGQERPASRLRFQGPGGGESTYTVCAFWCDEHPAAVITRSGPEADAETTARILASLESHGLGPDTRLPREVLGIRCSLPALANVGRGKIEGTEVLQAGFPDCQIELAVRLFDTPAQARTLLERALAGEDNAIRSLAAGSGMQVEHLQGITRWAGKGVAVGRLARLVAPGRDPLERQQFYLRAGAALLDLTVTYAPPDRDSAGQQLQGLLDSLDPTAIDSWIEQEYLGDGIYLDLNEKLPLERSSSPGRVRFELRPTCAGVAPATRLWFDLLEGDDAELSLETRLARAAAERLPGWELDSPTPVEAALFGATRSGLLLSARSGEEHALLCLFLASFGERWLAAGLVCREEERQADLALLAHVMAAAGDARSAGQMHYHDADLAVDIDPAIWTLESRTDAVDRVLELGCGELRITIRAHRREDSGFTLDSQPSRSLEEELAMTMDRLMGADPRDCAPVFFGPRLFKRGSALAACYLATAADGSQAVHSMYLADRDGGRLEIEVEAAAEDFEARGRGSDLLDTLEIAGAGIPAARILEDPRFRLHIPPGFEAQRRTEVESGMWVGPESGGDPGLLFQVFPLADLDTDDFSVREMLLDSVRQGIENADEEKVEAPLIPFGGNLKAGVRLIHTLSDDGAVRITDIYVFRDGRYEYRVMITGGREAMFVGASSLRSMLTTLEPLLE